MAEPSSVPVQWSLNLHFARTTAHLQATPALLTSTALVRCRSPRRSCEKSICDRCELLEHTPCSLDSISSCDTAARACVPNPSSSCHADSDCGGDMACESFACVPLVPLGDGCSITCAGGSCSCAGGGYCLSASNDPAVNGTCTAPNSLPSGSTHACSPLACPLLNATWYGAALYGNQLCVSGLAVPVPDPTGYASSAFACVSEVNIDNQGAACGSSCAWAPDTQAAPCKSLRTGQCISSRGARRPPSPCSCLYDCRRSSSYHWRRVTRVCASCPARLALRTPTVISLYGCLFFRECADYVL